MDSYEQLVSLIACILLTPALIGGAIGFLLGRRSRPRSILPPTGTPNAPSLAPSPDQRTHIVLEEIAHEPMRSILTDAQVAAIVDAYTRPEAPTPTVETAPVPTTPLRTPPRGFAWRRPTDATPRVETPVLRTPAPALQRAESVAHDRELDPAIMLLYAGALLIVAAGLIYAAYNWADFSALHKIGALAGTTLAFILAGTVFQRSERLRPAANSFLMIGALLVPANAIAAWQVIDGARARPELPLFFGAAATAIVHGIFSIRPGGRLYSAFAIIASAVAVASLPAAIGTDPRWGAPLTLAVLAFAPPFSAPLAHLAEPRRLVSLVVAPLALLVAGSALLEDGSARWVLPVTLVVVTLALTLVPSPLARLTTWAGQLATVTALAIVPATLPALNVTSPIAWGATIAATALVWAAAPMLIDRPGVRRLAPIMMVESAVTFYLATAVFANADAFGWVSLVTLAAVIAMGTIAWIFRWRWYLAVAALFGALLWRSNLEVFAGDISSLDRYQYATLFPLVLMFAALAVHRWWHGEDCQAAPLPLWLATLAAGAYVIVTGFERGISPTIVAVVAIYAIGALIAASATRQPLVLGGYGLLGALAVGLASWLWIDGAERLPATILGLALVALPSVPGAASRLADAVPPLDVFRRPRPRYELVPLGGAAAIALVGMLVIAAGSVASTYAIPPGGDTLEMRTSLVWLATFVAVLGVSLAAGRANDAAAARAWIARWTMLVFVVTLGFATSLVTDDAVIATWLVLAAAVAMIAAGTLARDAGGFVAQLRRIGPLTGGGLLVVALALNLLAVADAQRPEHPAGQVVVYALLAVVVGASGWRLRSHPQLHAGAALLAIATWFGVDWGDAGAQTTFLTFSALAWAMASVGLALRHRSVSDVAGTALCQSGLAIGVAAAVIALGRIPVADIEWDAARTVTTWWLLSVAGLLMLNAWALGRRDLAFGASASAMAALMLQIGERSPDTVLAYSVPLAIWLLALGYLERRHAPNANPLFGVGSVMLVLPTLLLANASGEFTWLLATLLEGLALFAGGLLLRLRIPIAAGVITLSIIALRMLLDAVNALPSWLALLAVGLVLLVGGTVWVSFRDPVRDARRRIEAHWSELD